VRQHSLLCRRISYRNSVRLSICLSVTRWHDHLASLGRHAQLIRCFSAVAELLVLVC